ncbi:alpha/beta hydrolase [Marisediminicola sp. LYQ134]|uniref:alpha/beta hydrolase n=1 Tax=Marisediminicola sp. LYQ134 TaxID=3391061 RepID=UPI003982DADE
MSRRATRPALATPARRRIVGGAAVAGVATLVAIGALAGCADDGVQRETAPDTAFPVLQDYPDVEVVEDLEFGSPDAGTRLDVCLPDEEAPPVAAGTTEPETSQPRAAVLIVHGGSWRQGDKADVAWRNVCEWLADEGFVAVNTNYRLAPEHPFPAGIEDVRTAVHWIRDDDQVERFDIDPDRVAVFGGSAGGNLASLLGVEGEGDLTSGSRVKGVVNLSGPADLTTAGFALGGVVASFRDIQLDYLGCADYESCGVAEEASPIYSVDPSDPPFFVGHSHDERIPMQQSDALVDALGDAGVATTYVTVPGTMHSIAMLNEEMRDRITEWLRVTLAP